MNTKGWWSKDDTRPAQNNKYLSYEIWIDSKFATLEHVAPKANPGKNKWDSAIYQSQYTVDTLGNLLLLPAKENSSVGNESWDKKRIFYSAFIETKKSGVNDRIDEAVDAGFSFQKSTKEMLRNGERLQFLDPIRDVDDWTKDFIEKRTDNIADLAWETIKPWLWGDDH